MLCGSIVALVPRALVLSLSPTFTTATLSKCPSRRIVVILCAARNESYRCARIVASSRRCRRCCQSWQAGAAYSEEPYFSVAALQSLNPALTDLQSLETTSERNAAATPSRRPSYSCRRTARRELRQHGHRYYGFLRR